MSRLLTGVVDLTRYAEPEHSPNGFGYFAYRSRAVTKVFCMLAGHLSSIQYRSEWEVRADTCAVHIEHLGVDSKFSEHEF